MEDGKFAPCTPPYGAVCDLQGACVLPAFLDAHSHLLAYALSLLQADGAACRTAADYAALAQTFAAAHGLGEDAPVTCKNADAFPPAEELDAIPRPIHLQARSGHAGMFNAAARRLFGIQKGGILEETDYLAATKRVPMPEGKALRAAFCTAQENYFVGGMTLAQEGYLSEEMFPLYRALCDEGALRIDVAAYPAPSSYDEALRLFPPRQSRLFIGGMKIFLDGSPQQKTALLRAPYTGGGYGTATMTEAEVREACRFAAARGAQLLAHCNGDGAIARFLHALGQLSPAARARIRPVVIHAQIMGEDLLDRAAELGVFLSFFPAHIRYWGDVHRKQLGRQRAGRISPARSALLRGIPFTLHQDSPVCKPAPLEAAACAVSRTTADGTQFRGQEIGVREALLALTRNAARQYGFADRGRIAEGMRADFLVCDRDPLSLPPKQLEQTRILAVYRAGECVFTKTP